MIRIIANPHSGGGKGEEATKAVCALLEAKQIPFTCHRSEYAGHSIVLARELSQQADTSALVALGGDGTFNEVLNGMQADLPLGLIGAGTGNDFLRAVQISSNPQEALEIILAGKQKRIDCLDVSGRKCLNIVGTGLDVEILMRANKLRKHIKGALSYYMALIHTLLFFSFRKAKVEYEGNTIETSCMMVSLANGRYCGGGLPVTPLAQVDDGLLDITLIHKFPRYKLPFLLGMFFKSKIYDIIQYVQHIRCREATVTVTPCLPLNLDGELVSTMPFTVRVLPASLTLFVP